MTVAQLSSVLSLLPAQLLATLALLRHRWFGGRHNLGVGFLLIVLLAILVGFLCIRAFTAGEKKQ
jgi:hypothetical protein